MLPDRLGIVKSQTGTMHIERHKVTIQRETDIPLVKAIPEIFVETSSTPSSWGTGPATI